MMQGAPTYEDRINSVLRKYPKYSSGPDHAGSTSIQKSRSYSNFDSLKRTDGDLFRNVNTLGQISESTSTHRPVAAYKKSLTGRLPNINYDEQAEDRETQRKKEVDDLISKYAKKKDKEEGTGQMKNGSRYSSMSYELPESGGPTPYNPNTGEYGLLLERSSALRSSRTSLLGLQESSQPVVPRYLQSSASSSNLSGLSSNLAGMTSNLTGMSNTFGGSQTYQLPRVPQQQQQLQQQPQQLLAPGEKSLSRAQKNFEHAWTADSSAITRSEQVQCRGQQQLKLVVRTVWWIWIRIGDGAGARLRSPTATPPTNPPVVCSCTQGVSDTR